VALRPIAARALARILALDDFEEPARRYLPRPMFGYVSGGAETNASLRANRAQFDEIELSPRVLVDVSGRTAKTTLFGRGYDAPFGIAPMAALPWRRSGATSSSRALRRKPASR